MSSPSLSLEIGKSEQGLKIITQRIEGKKHELDKKQVDIERKKQEIERKQSELERLQREQGGLESDATTIQADIDKLTVEQQTADSRLVSARQGFENEQKK